MKKVLFASFVVLSIGATSLAARPINRKIDRKFENADLNNDNLISQTEFLATQSKRSALVVAYHRFDYADSNLDGFLDLTEFRAARGGRAGGKPNKTRRFQLADENHDDLLDPFEFASTLRQRKSYAKVLRSFGKKDKNDDSVLSPAEFGIRGYQ